MLLRKKTDFQKRSLRLDLFTDASAIAIAEACLTLGIGISPTLWRDLETNADAS